jgi:hypothetical protein
VSTDFNPNIHKTEVINGTTYFIAYKSFNIDKSGRLSGNVINSFYYKWGKNTPAWITRVLRSISKLIPPFTKETIYGGVIHADHLHSDIFYVGETIAYIPIHFLAKDFVAYGDYNDIALKRIYIFKEVYDRHT